MLCFQKPDRLSRNNSHFSETDWCRGAQVRPSPARGRAISVRPYVVASWSTQDFHSELCMVERESHFCSNRSAVTTMPHDLHRGFALLTWTAIVTVRHHACRGGFLIPRGICAFGLQYVRWRPGYSLIASALPSCCASRSLRYRT